MNYEKVEIGEICDFVRGVAFDGNEVIGEKANEFIPILRAGNICETLEIHHDLVWVPCKRVSKDQYLRVGDIAICMASGSPAVLGKTAQLNHDFLGSVGAFCGIIRPKKADPLFVGYWFKSSLFMAWRDRQARGVNIQNLRPTEIQEIQIPLPPLPEQQRIAAILQKADRLRRLRRYARQLSDGYLQSVFLEMFGDPATNPRRFELVKLGDYISFITSGSRGWAEYYSEKGALFLRVQNVGSNSLLLDDVAFVHPPKTAESRRTKVQNGDLLISATADIGRTGVIPDNFPEAYINQHLFLIRLKYFNPFFVAGYFSTPSGKAQILQLDRGGVKSGLNFDDAKSLTIFNTTIANQERFAGIVQRYTNLCIRQRESERQAEHLFQSLLHRAFQGEL